MATSTETEHDADHDPGHGDTAHAHPGDSVYIKVALLLGALTAIEVGLSYAGLNTTITNTSLLLFAAVKFAIVVMYFMHLKFDHPVLRRLFVTGLVLAIFCYVAYLSTLGVFP